MKRTLKKTVSMILVLCIWLSCLCVSASSVEVGASHRSGQLSSGVYRLQNVGSGLYMDYISETVGYGVEQSSWKTQNDGNRSQLFKITYLGTYGEEPCYSIRPMTDNYFVLGSIYPEYMDVAEFYGVSYTDSYDVLGEKNVWYIIPDGNYYKLKNKYFGEAVDEIYGLTEYIDNAYLGAYDDEEFSKLGISIFEGDFESYGQWELIPYTNELERFVITNPIKRILVNSTYDFNAIAFSDKIGVNGPFGFSVQNITGSATIDSYSGVCQMITPGTIKVVITYGSLTRSYDVIIESESTDFDSSEEYYFLTIDEGSLTSAEDDKYLFMDDDSSIAARELAKAGNPEWKIERYSNSKYYTIRNTSSSISYGLSVSNSGGFAMQPISSVPSDGQLWEFIKTSDCTYIIRPKLFENTNSVLAAYYVDELNSYLTMSEYKSNSDYAYHWHIYSTGTDVMLMGIEEGSYEFTSHEHMTGLSYAMPPLYGLGYEEFNFVSISTSSLTDAQAQKESIKNQIIDNMEQCKVFISRSHGDYDEDETFLRLWLQEYKDENDNVISKVKVSALRATDIYDYETQTAKVDLSDCDIALFVACYTAKEGLYTLPDAAVRAGADFAIGFELNVTCGAASDWAREFLRLYYSKDIENTEICRIAEEAYRIVDSYGIYIQNGETNLSSVTVISSNTQ